MLSSVPVTWVRNVQFKKKKVAFSSLKLALQGGVLNSQTIFSADFRHFLKAIDHGFVKN